jgi:hypothetical protein
MFNKRNAVPSGVIVTRSGIAIASGNKISDSFVKLTMQTLGLSDSTPRTEGKIEGLLVADDPQ